MSCGVVDGMWPHIATEALGRVDLLDGLVAIAIDEVRKGQRHFTAVCDDFTGPVALGRHGRSKSRSGPFSMTNRRVQRAGDNQP